MSDISYLRPKLALSSAFLLLSFLLNACGSDSALRQEGNSENSVLEEASLRAGDATASLPAAKATAAFSDIAIMDQGDVAYTTILSQAIPPIIRKNLPDWTHEATPGRRGCVVGQGELKEDGWDPLFFLNHSYAMFWDGLKRLARRTWCTTKKVPCLELALNIYAWFHNLYLDSKDKRNLVLQWIL